MLDRASNEFPDISLRNLCRKHVRPSNPVESTFATGRLRTDKTKGCL